jgi:O-antigen ligase
VDRVLRGDRTVPGLRRSELLRLILGAGVYVAAAYGLRPDQLRTAVAATLAFGVLMAVYGFFQFGSDTAAERGAIGGAFGNHENLGSFLLLLFVPALVLALDRSGEEKTVLGMQVAALALGGALLLARTRAAWIGGGAALLALSFLAARHSPLRLDRRNKHLIVSPLAIIALAFALLVVAGQIAPLLSQRAATFARVTDDESFSDRWYRWRATTRMVSERPVAGWGLGAFPVLQGRWTHQGDDAHAVLSVGTSHSNLAHNFWLQWAAETGGVGLSLYVATVAAFLFSVGRALPAITSAYRKNLAMGAMAAVVGGAVDGIGSPAYTFPGVSTLFWLWMGLGIAACRETRQRVPALPPTPARTWLGAGLAGLRPPCW